jgi:hypothetical protein
MLLRDNKRVAAAERLDIEERIAVVRKFKCRIYLFAVSSILNDGISPLMIRQKIHADIACSLDGLVDRLLLEYPPT